MRAYLAVTGILFGLLAVLHVVRIFAEWDHFAQDTGHLAIMAAIGSVAAALAIWAWILFRSLRAP